MDLWRTRTKGDANGSKFKDMKERIFWKALIVLFLVKRSKKIVFKTVKFHICFISILSFFFSSLKCYIIFEPMLRKEITACYRLLPDVGLFFPIFFSAASICWSRSLSSVFICFFLKIPFSLFEKLFIFHSSCLPFHSFKILFDSITFFFLLNYYFYYEYLFPLLNMGCMKNAYLFYGMWQNYLKI